MHTACHGIIKYTNGPDPLLFTYSGETDVKNAYWCPITSKLNAGSYGTKVDTLKLMKTQSTYKGFDFETGKIWVMKEYPELAFLEN